MCIGDPSTYLTGVGLHDAITIMSLIFTFVTLCKTFWYCSWYILVAGYALSQQWFLNFLRKRRETIKKRNREGKRSINISLRVRNHTKLFQPYWRPRQLGVAKIMALWVINLSLCVWMEHEVCSYHYILLDQGYVPVIFWRITRSTAIHGLWGAEERLQSIFWNTNQQEAGEYCLHVFV